MDMAGEYRHLRSIPRQFVSDTHPFLVQGGVVMPKTIDLTGVLPEGRTSRRRVERLVP
jgi:hypothetical protein